MSTTQQSMDAAWQDPALAEKYALAEVATRPYAETILDKSSVVSNINQHNAAVNAFDIGCGTGAVIAALYDQVTKENWDNVKVLGGDISQAMLTYLDKRGEKNGWTGLSTKIVDGADIQLENNQFTHVFANLIIFFLPLGTMQKLFDLLQPGGFLGLTNWATLGWYPLLERAITNMADPPPCPTLSSIHDLFQRGNDWHEPSFVKQQLEDAGFQDVEVVTEKKKNIQFGTPKQFCDNMMMPMKMIAMQWEESKREDIVKRVMEEFRKVLAEVAGGEDKQLYMDLNGVVGVGWKPVKK
jgi:ubiquinone/menaquinone biosynthesis C-methylase UbiE